MVITYHNERMLVLLTVSQIERKKTTQHAIEILSTAVTSYVTMVHRSDLPGRPIPLLDCNIDNPCLALIPDRIACAAAARSWQGYHLGCLRAICKVQRLDSVRDAAHMRFPRDGQIAYTERHVS